MDLRPVPTGVPGEFTADIPDGWQQGRGAYGGVVLGLLARAMAIPDRPLRSLTAAIPAPTPVGRVAIEVAPLRVGTGVSTLEARMRTPEGVTAHAVGVLGRPRGTGGWSPSPPPDVPGWDDLPTTPRLGFSPPFTQHWEYRLVGPPPFSGSAPTVVGWQRAVNPGPGRDAGFLVAAADVWWPAAFSALSAPCGMATVSFAMQILVDPTEIDPTQPLLHVGTAEVMAEGYATDRRALWTASGRLVAINQQTFAAL